MPPFLRSTRRLLLAAIVVAGCGRAPTVPEVPAGALVLPSTLVDARLSSYGRLATPTRSVVRDAGAWASLWATIVSGYTPTPALPAVDFTSEMVIVAGMGTRSSGGYSIGIDGVYEAEGELFVTVTERSPGASCVTTAEMTAPVTAVRVARREAPVSFVQHNAVVNCMP